MSNFASEDLSSTAYEAKTDMEVSPAPTDTQSEAKPANGSTVGVMLHGAPTKEHRLLEYFLVISHGESLEVRKRTELMQVFEEHNDNLQQRQRTRRHRRKKRKKRKKTDGDGSSKSTKIVTKTVIKRIKRSELEKYRPTMIPNSELNFRALNRVNSAESASLGPVAVPAPNSPSQGANNNPDHSQLSPSPRNGPTSTNASNGANAANAANAANTSNTSIPGDPNNPTTPTHSDANPKGHIIKVTSVGSSHEKTLSSSLTAFAEELDRAAAREDEFVDIEVQIQIPIPLLNSQSSPPAPPISSNGVSGAPGSPAAPGRAAAAGGAGPGGPSDGVTVGTPVRHAAPRAPTPEPPGGPGGPNGASGNKSNSSDSAGSGADEDSDDERGRRMSHGGADQTFVSIHDGGRDRKRSMASLASNKSKRDLMKTGSTTDLLAKIGRVLSTPRLGGMSEEDLTKREANDVDDDGMGLDDMDEADRRQSGSIVVKEANAELERENLFQRLKFKPTIVDRFPALDHQDTELIKTGTQLQHFCLPTGLFLTRYPGLPIFYTFVWTQLSGERLYGACLRFFETVDPKIIHKFCQTAKNEGDDEVTQEIDAELHQLTEDDLKNYFAPKCLCIISYHPFIEAYRTFLTELYRLSLTPCKVPMERYLSNFFLETPLPPRGYFAVRYRIGDKSFRMARPPHNNPLVESPISSRVVFELFDIETILVIYRAMLLEYKVCFVSTQYSILTLVTEIFRSLMYPFDWPHVYIPILPEDFLMFLRAPTVYIIGTHKSLLPSLDELPSDILVVDVDEGFVRRTDDSVSSIPLPKHECKKLERFLNPVSQILHGTKSQEFHQLDLAFPVAPTPDMIEMHEEMQQTKYNEMKKSNSSHTNLPPAGQSHHKSSASKTKFTGWKSFKWGKKRNNGENPTSPTKDAEPPFLAHTHSKSRSLHGGFRSRDSIESPIRPRLQSLLRQEMSIDPTQVIDESGPYPSASGASGPDATRQKSHHRRDSSGDLSDITPLNAIFSDAAVRNGFLRFWVSLLRAYRDFMIYPKGVKNPLSNNLNSPYSPPMNREYSATSEPDGTVEDSETSTTYTVASQTPQTQNQSHLQTPHKGPQNPSNAAGPGDANKREHSRARSYDSGLTNTASAATGTAQASQPSQGSNASNASNASNPSHASHASNGSHHSNNSNASQGALPLGINDLDPNAKLFDEDKFLKSFPSSTRTFMKRFLKTEAWVRFIEKRIFDATAEENEVKYFDEKIKEKLGRSRFAKAEATPFLDNTDYAIASEFEVPPPQTADLSSKVFVYPVWPKLDSKLFSKARDANALKGKQAAAQQDANGRQADASGGTGADSGAGAVVTKSASLNHAPISVGTSEDSSEASENPFFVDRIVYHLWFYIFLRTLQRPDPATEKALHLMVKIVTQMLNESIGLADHWVFVEMVEAMGRCGWGNQTLKLVEVMNEFGFEPTDAIYSSLLGVLTQQFGDLQVAYNILGRLPKKIEENKRQMSDNKELRARRNSLLLNVNLKPVAKRRKFYETIGELKARFCQQFPGRKIIISEECPRCKEPLKDVHIRLGWTNRELDYSTKCPVCNHKFDGRFAVKEPHTYRVFYNTHDLSGTSPRGSSSLKNIKLFTLRNEGGAYVKFHRISSKIHKTVSMPVGAAAADEMNVFERGVTHESTNSLLLQLEQSTTSVASMNGSDLGSRDISMSNLIQSGDAIININGADTKGMTLAQVEDMLANPPVPSGDLAREMELFFSKAGAAGAAASKGKGRVKNMADGASHLAPNGSDNEGSLDGSDSFRSVTEYSDNEDKTAASSNTGSEVSSGNSLVVDKKGGQNKKKKRKRSFMFRKSKEPKEPVQQVKKQTMVCITLQRTIWCKYFSPVILYNEIRKVMQTHAAVIRKNSQTKKKKNANGSKLDGVDENGKELNGNDANGAVVQDASDEKEETGMLLKDVMIECGVEAIANVEFREKFPQLFWNLAWQFSNLRLPLHFLKDAFIDPKTEINLEPIEDLIEFLHISEDDAKNDPFADLVASIHKMGANGTSGASSNGKTDGRGSRKSTSGQD